MLEAPLKGEMLIHILGGSHVMDVSTFQDHYLARYLHCLLLIMGDEDGCHGHLLVQSPQPVA